MSAQEIVRRAERGIGVCIRRGQAAGEIRMKGQGSREGQLPVDSRKLSPTDFVPEHELSSNGTGIYQMTDGVPDEKFEQAITEAKAERNLSRANVVRKVRNGFSILTGRAIA